VLIASFALGAGGAVLGGWLGSIVADLVHASPDTGRLLGFVLASTLVIFAGVPAVRRLITLRYKHRLAARGASGPFPTTYEITDQAFVYSIGGITKLVRWEVISEVFQAKRWWVLMAQGEAYYIPMRAFSGEISENTFISAILDRLNPEARARCRISAGVAASLTPRPT
jgi:hypothetical protein